MTRGSWMMILGLCGGLAGFVDEASAARSSGWADPPPARSIEGAQASGPPEAVARLYHRSLQRLRWRDLTELLHGETLAEFDRIARMLVSRPRGQEVLDALYDSVSIETFEAWDGSTRVVRTLEGMTRYARGLMESQVSTRTRILGMVGEGEELAHVLYRATTDHMGAVRSEVSVVTLARERGSWKILADNELEVLQAALLGLPAGRDAPDVPIGGGL